MMLSKSTEYAVRALVFVQLQNWMGKRPGVVEISKEIEAPTAYSAKILHTLTTHRLLNSMKGRGGGFYFTDSRSDLSIYQVILIMEGDGIFTQCGIGLKNCSDANPCPLHEQYGRIRDQLLILVQTETISSMAQKIRNGRAVLNRLMQHSL